MMDLLHLYLPGRSQKWQQSQTLLSIIFSSFFLSFFRCFFFLLFFSFYFLFFRFLQQLLYITVPMVGGNTPKSIHSLLYKKSAKGH